MSIKLQLPKLVDIKPRLTVIGVGGAGCNAVNNMIAAGLQGVEFVVANTDAQSLAASSAEHRIQLGANLTEGLGAGSRPEIGEAAAEEAIEEIRAHIAGSHMVFIAAGMGGGTGTGAASVIARTAREAGILTVAIVCKPFQFEGQRRMRMADAGVQALRQHVDTLIVIPNQNLFRIANERTTFAEAFVLADQVLYSGVACIVELVLKEGLINLDFADVKTVMSGMGTAMMGTGEATGERRAVLAAEEAIANPLLDDVTLKGAKGLLLSITGGRDLTLYEVDEAASRVRQEVDPDANIIVGATFDDNLGDRLRVSIVASGMGRAEQMMRHAAPAAAAPAQSPSVAPVAHPAPSHTAYAGHAPHHGGSVQTNPGPSYPQPSPQSHAHPIDDMHRRLTEALQPAPAPIQHAPPPAPHHAPVHGHQPGSQLGGHTVNHAVPPPQGLAEQVRAHREQWAAPGNVMIEDGLHGFAPATSDLAHGHHETVPSMTAWPHGGAFQPQAPAEFQRTARRMPAVEDFPPLAQQEWHAKQAPEPAGHTSARAPEERKNTGLLGRLGIIGRRNESQPESSTASEHETRPQVSFGRERR